MVYKKTKIRNLIHNFIKKTKEKIPVSKVILFGSYAYGKPKKYSDIDIAVISPKFKRMNDIKRIMLLSDIARKVNNTFTIDIDPIGFTEEEIEGSNYFELAGEIKEKGEIIYQSHYIV